MINFYAYAGKKIHTLPADNETERASEKIVTWQVNSIVDELFAASVHRLSATAAYIRKVNSSVRTLARICNLRFV